MPDPVVNSPTTDRPWLRAIKVGTAFWLASRALYLAVEFMSWSVNRDRPRGFDAGMWSGLVSGWGQWDGLHYVAIAQSGYLPGTGYPAFFPFYPLLIRGLDEILPLRAQSTALIVSALASLGLLVVLYRLVEQELGDRLSQRAVLYLLVFPTGFFLAMAYNESLFLFLVVSSLYCMRKGHWWSAGLLGALASGTRAAGILLILPFVYEYLRQRGFRLRAIRASALAVFLVPVGLLAYVWYSWVWLGDPLAFSHAQSLWGRGGAGWPWMPWWQTVTAVAQEGGRNPETVIDVLDAGVVLMVTALLVLCVVGPWKLQRDQLYLVIFGVAAFLMALCYPVEARHPMVSINRYAIEVIPIFLLLAKLGEHKYVDRFYVVGATVLQVPLMMLFIRGSWAG